MAIRCFMRDKFYVDRAHSSFLTFSSNPKALPWNKSINYSFHSFLFLSQDVHAGVLERRFTTTIQPRTWFTQIERHNKLQTIIRIAKFLPRKQPEKNIAWFSSSAIYFTSLHAPDAVNKRAYTPHHQPRSIRL